MDKRMEERLIEIMNTTRDIPTGQLLYNEECRNIDQCHEELAKYGAWDCTTCPLYKKETK